jgi:hypothetical protein
MSGEGSVVIRKKANQYALASHEFDIIIDFINQRITAFNDMQISFQHNAHKKGKVANISIYSTKKKDKEF